MPTSDATERVIDSALSEFPVIGDQIGENVHSFHAGGAALAVGIAGSLYGALGVAQAAQYALNKIWAVPRHARPDPLRSRLKGLLFLSILAVGLCVATGLTPWSPRPASSAPASPPASGSVPHWGRPS
ncbi:YhjD/YihY/BrkB family envelope integrity protein [Streptomyces sp. NPDC001759]